MHKIVIDARESGTSTGRYIDKLIEYLHKLKPDEEFIVLTKSPRIGFMQNIAPNFKIIESPFKEFTFAEQLGFLGQINNLRADLVHFCMVQQPLLYRGKVITTMHDLTMTWEKNPARNSALHWTKQQVYKSVNRYAAHKSARIITPTKYVKDAVIQFTGVSPEKITVTYEAADKISDKPEPVYGLEDKRFIMYIGRPMPHKNLERLIEAFIMLKAKHADLHLVLAGKKDSNYDRIERFTKDKNLKDIIFTGFIEEGQLRWLYEHCDAYVFPSLSEGFGLPGLEAMQHGAPVVSSNASCLPEVYGRAARYFDPLDTDDMAAAIEDVLTSKKLHDELVTLGQKQVKKYSWQKMAEETLAVYQQVLRS